MSLSVVINTVQHNVNHDMTINLKARRTQARTALASPATSTYWSLPSTRRGLRLARVTRALKSFEGLGFNVLGLGLKEFGGGFRE